MLWKKSSSVVKWIFIISIIELLLALFITIFLIDDQYIENTKEMNMREVMIVFEIISYVILALYIFKFYKNYKEIKVIDSTKKLIENIINTRKTVKTYINIMLFLCGVYMIIFLGIIIFTENEINHNIVNFLNEKKFSLYLGVTFIIIIYLILISLMIALFWLVYQLLYGLFLKNLKVNLKELKQIDLQN